VIEGSVFANDHDDMLDGRSGGSVLGKLLSGFLSGDRDRRSQVDKQSKQARGNREVLSGLRQKT
jgi:hypothetical protein